MAKIFRKIGHILSGYYVLMFENPTPEAVKRKVICKDCSLRKYFVCGECGCVISAKVVLEEESCPLGKW